MGVVTGKGLLALVRERYGAARGRGWSSRALVVANIGTLCAEFAGVAAGMDLLSGHEPLRQRPARGDRRLGCSSCAGPSTASSTSCSRSARSSSPTSSPGVLAHPDWGDGREGPGRARASRSTATRCWSPWRPSARRWRPGGSPSSSPTPSTSGCRVKDLRYERVDVVVGAVLTGVIGLFVVVACAATLHVEGIDDQRRQRRRPRARAARRAASAATLFGLGFLGAALLAAAIVPLSTAYSVSEAVGARSDIDDTFQRGAALLPELRRRRPGRRRDRADPGRAADPDPLPLPGAQRRPAARCCCPSCARSAATGADGRARARPARAVATGVALALIVASVLALAVPHRGRVM